jgi:uncharacterized membrane protein YagU involved in acid resistance
MAAGVGGVGRKLWVSAVAGIVAAVVEMAVVLPIQAKLGATPAQVFQSIAAGAVGRAAFAGGLQMVALGVVLHTLISLVAAALFVFATDRLPVLLRRPVVSGVLYGAACYVVMTFVVMPLSKIGFSMPKTLFLFSLSFGVHLFAFGLPIGLAARAMLGQPTRALGSVSGGLRA